MSQHTNITSGNSAKKDNPKNEKKVVMPPPGRTRLIRLPEVLGRVGLSRTTVYDSVSKGRFPAPVKLGSRSVAWRESDVDEWIDKRVSRSIQAIGRQTVRGANNGQKQR